MPTLPSFNQLRAISIIPMVTGSLSIFGSILILYIVYRSYLKLTTTYHRLMYGLAISDILQSLSLSFSSIPVPSDTPGIPYAMGNQMTCNFQGFIGTIGKTALTFYYCGLTGYFLLSIKSFEFVTDEFLSKRYEPFIHILSISYAVIGATVIWIQNGFFTSGNSCWIASKPMFCDTLLDVECEQGQDTSKYQWVIGGPIIVSFCFVTTNMLVIFATLLRQNRESHLSLGSNLNENENGNGNRRSVGRHRDGGTIRNRGSDANANAIMESTAEIEMTRRLPITLGLGISRSVSRDGSISTRDENRNEHVVDDLGNSHYSAVDHEDVETCRLNLNSTRDVTIQQSVQMQHQDTCQLNYHPQQQHLLQQ